MGVCTTMYAVNTKMMKKIKADNENLAFVVGECEENEVWNVTKYEFDKSIEVFIDIFDVAGAKRSAKLINSEYADLDIFEYDSYDIWTVSPAKVKTMVKELESINIELLKTKEGNEEITDRRNRILTKDELASYLDDLSDIKQFLNETSLQSNYLIFTEA
ncbi:MAG: DUF1877 family protein [Raineya sp.]|jgi:hypothetical protein|nr:DUF1877 family protein [Raineya sp.]